MALHQDMQLLIKSIREPILFFLPRNVLEEVLNKDLSNLEALGFLNTLFLTNAKGETKPLNHITEVLQILNKGKILKSNVFELLALRTSLDKSAFHYLIDDYFKELTTWIYATNITKEEAKNHVTNYQPEVQNYLESQNQVLKDHQEELKKHFGEWKILFEVERVFKSSPYDLNKMDFKKIALNPKLPTAKTGSAIKPISKKTKTKTLVLTEDEANHYLLKTVFNVDFSKINNG